MKRKAFSLLGLGLLVIGVQSGLGQSVGNELRPDPKEANTRVATRGANFLEIGVGARGLALAGAGATLQPGVFAMYWNPAGIAATESFGVGFSYSALYDELDIDYFFGGGLLTFAGGTLGLSWASLSSGDITRTTENFPSGGDPIFGSTFNWTSTYVGVYYARRITDRLNMGGGIKFISEGIDEASANWVAFDAGVTFRTGLYGIELGATAQNIGTEASFKGAAIQRIIQGSQQLFPPTGRDIATEFDTRDVQLPTLFRFTINLDILGGPESLVRTGTPSHGLNAALDLTDAVDSDLQTAVGIEYSFRKVAFLRVGKRFFNENQRTGDIQAAVGATGDFFRQEDFRDFSHGLSFGGGIRIPALGRSVAFDYAYVDMGELENVQVLSFEFGL
jgi:hypothetical protein